MVIRLQNGTARRVPHSPETRVPPVKSEVLILLGQDG